MDWRDDRIGAAQRGENPTVQFLADADLLATAVERACRSTDPAFRRVNLEILGNTDEFVHAHVWPRYTWEPADLVTRPVWVYDASRWRDPDTALGTEPAGLRERIRAELDHLLAGDRLVVGEPGKPSEEVTHSRCGG